MGRNDPVILRQRMVEVQIRQRGISDPRILRALETVPRHEFVPNVRPKEAYKDGPLYIGKGQTISQPYVCAYMTSLLQLRPTDRALEIGTGSGYQAAILSQVCEEVYSVEIILTLYKQALEALRRLGYSRVQVRQGDGRDGWPSKAPFNGIIVTAACADEAPPPLLEQLAVGGRLVIPQGQHVADQCLYVYKRQKKGIQRRTDLPVRFVPLVRGD